VALSVTMIGACRLRSVWHLCRALQCSQADAIPDFLERCVGEEERAEFERHVDGCAVCSELLAEYGRAFFSSARDREAPLESMAIGERAGRYVILGWLGRGGMGVVYRAYDPHLERQVALKVIRATKEVEVTEERRKRLLREAALMARIRHPNVVSVYDASTHDQQVFLVQELVVGQTLETIRDERPGWRKVVELYVQAGRGLSAAHAVGIVHRDFKPSNVLVDGDGVAKVTDFGLARHLDGRRPEPTDSEESTERRSTAPLTRDRGLLGTPHYMAPEQRHGQSNPLSDQYAFCVALREALAEGSCDRTAPLPRSVPGYVRRSLERGLSADPWKRFPSMAALLDSLSTAPARRSKWALSGGVVAVVSALVAIVGVRHERAKAAVCSEFETHLDRIWAEPQKVHLRQLLAPNGTPTEKELVTLTERALNDWAARWKSAKVEACRATHVRKEQSTELLDLQAACLDRQLYEFGALVGGLEGLPPHRREAAPQAASGLSQPESCADVHSLLTLDKPPPEPRIRSEIEGLYRAFGEMRAASLLGRSADAIAAFDGLEKRAATLGYRPVEAGIALFGAGLQKQRVHYGEAEQLSRRAILLAESAHDDDVVFRGWILRVHMYGEMSQIDEMHRAKEDAEAALDRAGRTHFREGIFDDAVAHSLMYEGKHAEAVDWSKRALVHMRAVAARPEDASLAPASVNVALATVSLGKVLARMHRLEEAAGFLQEGVRALEGLVGSGNPMLANPLLILGDLQFEQEKFADATATHRRAVGVCQAGEPKRCLPQALVSLAHDQWRAKSEAEAFATIVQAVAAGERLLGPDEPQVANIRLASAIMRIDAKSVGMNREGEFSTPKLLADLERVVAVFEGFKGDHAYLAGAKWALARALIVRSGNRARAELLARQAREILISQRQPANAAAIDTWLSEHRANAKK